MKCTIQHSLAALLSFALILPLSVHAAQDDDQNKDNQEGQTQVEQKQEADEPIFPEAESDREEAQNAAETAPRIQTDRRDLDDQSAVEGQHSDKTAKAFELKHRSPEEMKQLIKMCDEGLKPHEVGAQSQRPGQQPGVRQQDRIQRDQQRPGAQPGQQPGVQPGVQPNQQQPGQQAGSRQQTNRATYDDSMKGQKKIDVAVSEENDILFVRASQEHMKQVEKLVECFDVEDEKLKKAEMDKVTIIPVSMEDARQAETTLQREQLRNHQIFQMGQVALVVIGDDEQNGENRKKAEEAVSEFEKEGDKDAASDTDRPESQRDPLNPQAQPNPSAPRTPGQPGQTPQPQSTN